MRLRIHWMLMLLVALLFACQTSKPPPTPTPPTPQPPVSPTPPSSGPTSFDLIDDALSAGTLDAETALTYRVFATFNDARLPAQYRGNASLQTEGQDLRDVLEALPTLSAATQAKLEPFLIPPIYKSSWLSTPASIRSASLSIRCRDELRDDWYSEARTGGRFRVWYTAGQTDVAYAKTALDALEDEIYPKLIGLGLNPPASDASHDCNGGDEKLDVYLVPNFGVHGVDNAIGLAEPRCGSGTGVSSYLLAKNGMDTETLKIVLAHEFMHAIQFEYSTIRCSGEYRWMMEATADWAGDFVYPKNNFEQVQHAPFFLDSPEKALNDPNAKTQKNLRKYGAYLFFQFLTNTLGNDRIKAIFEGSTNTTSLEAVNNNIAGGFKDQWWKFSKTLWNQAPIDAKPGSFKQWDGLTQKPDQRDLDGDLKGAPEATETLEGEALSVSSRYYHFSFSDSNTRSLLFYNGFFDQVKAGKAIKVTALWKDAAGTWQEEDDWSDYKYVGLCRDLKNQRASELVIIVSNGEKTSGGKVTATKAPYLKRNNMGCYKFECQVNLLEKHSSWNGLGRKAVSNMAFELDPRALALDAKNPQIPDSLRLGLTFVFPLSGTDYTFEESYSTGCSFSFGPATFPLSVVPGKTAGFVLTNPFPELESNDPEIQKLINLPSRAYSAAALDNQMISVTVSGQGCHSPAQDVVGGLLLTNDAKNGVLLNPPLVKPNGTMQGNFKTSDASFDWTFTPQSEP
jgi:hypothetical protein